MEKELYRMPLAHCKTATEIYAKILANVPQEHRPKLENDFHTVVVVLKDSKTGEHLFRLDTDYEALKK